MKGGFFLRLGMGLLLDGPILLSLITFFKPYKRKRLCSPMLNDEAAGPPAAAEKQQDGDGPALAPEGRRYITA